MTMSQRSSCSSRRSKPAASAPYFAASAWARSGVLLTTHRWRLPRLDRHCQHQLAGLPGADQQRRVLLEVAEDPAGQLHGGIAHGGGPLVDPRLGAHGLADLEALVEQAVQDRPGVLPGRADVVGRLDLPQDLVLAQHHGVQTGGHPEQVAHRLLLLGRVEQSLALLPHALEGAEEALDRGNVPLTAGLGGAEVDLRAVAGGKHHHGVERLLLPQLLDEPLDFRLVENEALANLHGRALVVEPHHADHRSSSLRRICSTSGSSSRASRTFFCAPSAAVSLIRALASRTLARSSSSPG